ncbi:putative ribonuclease H-like domain-containing protein [Tanacetum coccineum]
MGFLALLLNKEETIKSFKIACLLAFYHKKNPKRNKKEERGIMIKNKARLVAQGYTQEEGIDYDEDFAHVARIEAIRLFLAYASFKDFVVYQMDVKSDFLYGKIKEEVYVCQPPEFEDPNFPDRTETYYQKDKSDILLVQVYVDDIIFGSTRKKMCTEFEKMMHKKFQIFYYICGRAYIFLRFNVSVCACARFQVNPKVSHLHAVKRIFRYLKGQPKLGLWYPKDSPFDLVAYTDSTIRIKIDDGNAFWNEIEVNANDSKLMLLGIHLLLLVKLMLPGITYYCWATAGSVNAVRLNLVLLVKVNVVEGDFINTSIEGFF